MRFKVLNKIAPQNRILYKAEAIADKVLEFEEEIASKTDEQLKLRTQEIIEALTNDELIDHYLAEALAIGREMMYRVHGLKAYRVQLIGSIVVHFGDFAEMMTGEGKTLTLVLAAFVNALFKKGVHVVTVNEYLVQRDAEFAGAMLSRLGLTCGYITAAMDNNIKRQNYGYDVTYVPNSELGFDYLRDNMVSNYEDKVQRGLFFAIVDEADSVLIDEARTPLIIAGQPASDIGEYVKVDRFVKTLEQNDYIIDGETNSINLSEFGVDKAQSFFNVGNIYDLEFSETVHKITNSLRANFVFNNGVEYIVRKNNEGKEEIALVDQFTGRIMEGRSYSAGLQQAIQAKEMVEIEPENLTVATVTYQSLFRIYKKLSGVSGTAATEAEELLNIYNMVVIRIPTNKPVVRVDHPDFVFDNKKTKWKYVVAEIKKRHKTGQPILVGTAAVEDSEILHLLLQRIGINHVVLNAKNHAQEAAIIENAGQLGQVTIATYMAGRGTDIKLGEGVRELGGLFVIGTERNESRRVDNQLRGRSGRQGDPGESRFFISLQDSLFKRFATNKFDKANDKISDDVIDLKFFTRLLNNTQKRVEGLNYDIRKSLIDYDYVLSSQRELFYKQRDKILLAKNIDHILFRMIGHVVNALILKNIDQVNRDTVHVEELVKRFNEDLFFSDYLKYHEIKNYQIEPLYQELYDKTKAFILDKQNEITEYLFQPQVKQIIVKSMDDGWTRHLDLVGKLKDGVNLRAYEQKSPLNIYVADADKLFHEMIRLIAFNVIKAIARMGQMQNIELNVNPFNNPGNIQINLDTPDVQNHTQEQEINFEQPVNVDENVLLQEQYNDAVSMSEQLNQEQLLEPITLGVKANLQGNDYFVNQEETVENFQNNQANFGGDNAVSINSYETENAFSTTELNDNFSKQIISTEDFSNRIMSAADENFLSRISQNSETVVDLFAEINDVIIDGQQELFK